MNKKKNKEGLHLLIKILVIGFVIFLLSTFVFGVLIVKDNNMYPRISEGDLLLYYRLSDEYNSGDVVVCEVNGETVVGRVIAKGGDIVDFTKDGRILVNNMPLGQEMFYNVIPNQDGPIEYPLTIENSQYFILSDYSAESEKDSRTFGTVSNKEIKGETITVARRRGF